MNHGNKKHCYKAPATLKTILRCELRLHFVKSKQEIKTTRFKQLSYLHLDCKTVAAGFFFSKSVKKSVNRGENLTRAKRVRRERLLQMVRTSLPSLALCDYCEYCTQKYGLFCSVIYVGFHMTSLKFKLKKLSILPRFYFHDALEQLKTNFHTNFRF